MTRRRTLVGGVGLALAGALIAGCAFRDWSGQAASRQGESAASATKSFQNPVYNRDFPDPVVLKAKDGWYYAYSTQTQQDGKWFNIPVIRSRDLVSWTFVGDALPQKPKWAATTQNTWAPHVSEFDGKYYMYYSAEPDSRDGLALAVAVADSPAGPFKDMGRPLAKGPGFENIDPFPFDDPVTGKRLLYWGSGFQPIRVQELGPDRLTFARGSKRLDVLAPEKKPYENLIEGAWVEYRDGWYYLFYSGDNCCVEETRYAVSVARSRTATGPFEKLSEVRKTPDSVFLRPNDAWRGPGHHAIVKDDAGQDWIVYHAIDPRQWHIPGTENVRRPLLIDRLFYRDGWPDVEEDAPSTERRRAPVIR